MEGGPFPPLWAHGDYTKLKLIIRLEKKDYNPNEPVTIMFFARNDSNNEVTIQDSASIEDGHSFGRLFHSNYDEVPMTNEWGKMSRLNRLNRESEVFGEYGRTLRSMRGSGAHTKLQPGKERRLDRSQLNRYFDLSKPDTYELTCFLATACFGQYYELPLQSNTLTFRILEDGEKAKNTEEGMNPPKGKEVFKQPKPPKSVFYVYEGDEPDDPWIQTDNGRFIAKPRKIIDISPEMYYRQKATGVTPQSLSNGIELH